MTKGTIHIIFNNLKVTLWLYPTGTSIQKCYIQEFIQAVSQVKLCEVWTVTAFFNLKEH